MSDITNPIFQSEGKARTYLEATRWPDGPVCPHCGKMDATKLKGVKDKKGRVRDGLYQCNKCRKQYTVTIGTVFERSKIPLNKWMLATFLLSSSKKGISTHQLHRMLGVTYKTAWFMAHRIREAMRPANPTPMGGEGVKVEVDETFLGFQDPKKRRVSGTGNKMKVLTLLERGGRARSYNIKSASIAGIMPVLRTQLKRESEVLTDDASYYRNLRLIYKSHDTVNHSKFEWSRGEIHTNTIEGFFSIFKRGMRGVYQHCKEHHLHRYLAEFDFRYSHHRISDWERTSIALKGIEGKRLTYRRTT